MTAWTAKAIPDQTGRIAIVTGANTGIGLVTATELANHGAHVVLACRDPIRGKNAVAEIKQQHPSASVTAMDLDLSSLVSIKRFANDFLTEHTRLDLLINNAGVMIPPLMHTDEGLELQFGVNHLGHFALTGHLIKCACSTPGARIVTVSSIAHKRGVLDLDNLYGQTSYNRIREYSQSKLCNLLFTFELQRRLAKVDTDLIAVAAHPGVTDTDLGRHIPILRWLSGMSRWIPYLGTQPPQMGALPSLYAATHPDIVGSDYIGPSGFREMSGHPVHVGSSKRANDLEAATALWEASESLSGVCFP